MRLEIGEYIEENTYNNKNLKIEIGRIENNFSGNTGKLLVETGKKKISENKIPEKRKTKRIQSQNLLKMQRGQKISLENLNNIDIGISWKNPNNLDIDLSVFMVDKNGKTKEEDLIFYNNPENNCIKLKEHTSYDKSIFISLDKIPYYVDRLAISLTINKARENNHVFSMIKNTSLAIINLTENKEIIEYDFSELLENQTALVIAEIYKYKNEWKIMAIGNGFNGGLAKLCENYGIDLL